MSDLTSMLRVVSAGARQSDTAVTTELIAVAQEHGVATLLYDLQLAEGVPTAQLLLNIARQETALELARMIGIRQLLDCLAGAGIPVLLLKGSALAYWLYDNPAQRSRCDLDILVADITSAKRAVTALAQLGYLQSIETVEDSAEFEVALERTSRGGLLHRVDLHWRVLNHARLAEGLDFAHLDAVAINIPALECGARGLGIVHALLHALLHRITNMPSGQHDRLIWLYDIHLLVQRCTVEEWNEFVHQCASLACAMPCLDGLRATRAVFGTPLPDAVERNLEVQARNETWQLGALKTRLLLTWPIKLGLN